MRSPSRNHVSALRPSAEGAAVPARRRLRFCAMTMLGLLCACAAWTNNRPLAAIVVASGGKPEGREIHRSVTFFG